MSQQRPKPRIVAIETSSRVGSVAIGRGRDILDRLNFAAHLNHAVELLPAIDQLTSRHGWPGGGVDHFYVSTGPGSFTGLRIGITVARALALAAGARVVAVPTVDVLAVNALDLPDPPTNLAVVLDAKRRQVYAAVFRLVDDRYRKTIDACVITPADLLSRTSRPLTVLGEGVDYHRHALTGPDIDLLPSERWRPRVEVVYQLGWQLAEANQFADPKTLIPTYLRRPEAEELWNARHPAK